MCIVMFDWNPGSDLPITVLANREESPHRPMTEPKRLKLQFEEAVIAGEDHGPDGTFPDIGTWIGVNKNGMVVAVTNRDDGVLQGAEQVNSRGLLCMGLLDTWNAVEAITAAMCSLETGAYGGCNLLIMQGSSCHIVHAPGPKNVTVKAMPTGLHCITTLDVDDPYDPRIQHVLKTMKRNDFLGHLKIATSEEIVIRDPEWATICSSLISVGNKERGTTFWHARGTPPREKDYVSYTHLTESFHAQ